jgi:hypothetical protein
MDRRTALSAIALPVVAGCGTKPTAPSSSLLRIPVEKYATTIYLPPLGVEQATNIGDAMISTRRIALLPAIRLSTNVVAQAPYSSSYRLEGVVRPGVFSLYAHDGSGGEFFKSSQPLTLTYKGLQPSSKDAEGGSLDHGIFLPPAGPARIYFFWGPTYTSPEFLTAPEFSFSKETLELRLAQETLQKELVYTGVSQSTISIRYREYWDGAAREPFYQDVKYDISQGNQIGFKDARFEVIEANNKTIKYRVTTHLGTSSK